MPRAYAFRLLFLSLVFFAEAVWLRDRHLLAAGFAYLAFTFFLVSICYFRPAFAPRLFLKRPDGSRSPLAWLFLFPYLALIELSFTLYRLTAKQPAFSTIAPNLILGRRATNSEATRLCDEGVVAVVDLTCEFAESSVFRNRAAYLALPVLDADAPTLAQLAAATRFIAEHSACGCVFVHCALGHGRSATVVLAHLIASKNVASLDSGINKIKAARPAVELNEIQRALINDFAAWISNSPNSLLAQRGKAAMRFTMESAKPIDNPTPMQLQKCLRKLKLAGKHEYAVLEDPDGNYVQVAGGGVACMLEMRRTQPLKHFRAFQDKHHPVFRDGTKLRFAGSEVTLSSNEWLTIDQVIEVFLGFHAGSPWPAWVKWRDISDVVL